MAVALMALIWAELSCAKSSVSISANWADPKAAMTVLLNLSACSVLKATIKSVDSALTCTALSAFTAALVSDAKFIGNVIYDNSALGSFPVAAAYSFVPIGVMIAYLYFARRLGAFESL